LRAMAGAENLQPKHWMSGDQLAERRGP